LACYFPFDDEPDEATKIGKKEDLPDGMEELGAPGAPLPSDKAKWVVDDTATPQSGTGDFVVWTFFMVLTCVTMLVFAAYYYNRNIQSTESARGLQSARPFDDQDDVLLLKLREREYARGANNAALYPQQGLPGGQGGGGDV